MVDKVAFQWPPIVRENVIVKDAKILNLREQAIDYAIDRATYLAMYHEKIINTFTAAPFNGAVIMGEYDDGTPYPNEYTISLGTTSVTIECDDNMMPALCAHAFDLRTPQSKTYSECSLIAQVLEALIYRGCPDKAKFQMDLGKKYLRNASTLDGLTDLSNRLKQDPILLNNAVSGAHFEKEEIDVPDK